MRKFVLAALALGLISTAFAQKDSTQHSILPSKKEAPSNDHFLIQLGYLSWKNKPDSINTKGFPRSINLYLMMNFPFKTDPHWSVALGPGIATDNMYFNKMNVGITGTSTSIRFQNVSDTIHFRKTKLSTVFLELPVELRYRFNPNNDRKSVKLALGAKVGLLMNAHTRQVDLQNSGGQLINAYTEKLASKNYFSKQRLSVQARVGYGVFSLFASYSITPVFKQGYGPQVRPLSIGITLSGL